MVNRIFGSPRIAFFASSRRNSLTTGSASRIRRAADTKSQGSPYSFSPSWAELSLDLGLIVRPKSLHRWTACIALAIDDQGRIAVSRHRRPICPPRFAFSEAICVLRRSFSRPALSSCRGASWRLTWSAERSLPICVAVDCAPYILAHSAQVRTPTDTGEYDRISKAARG